MASKRISAPPPPLQRTPSREGRMGSMALAPPGTPELIGSAILAQPLRVEGFMVTQTGREHLRRGQMSEDIPFAEYPLRGGAQRDATARMPRVHSMRLGSIDAIRGSPPPLLVMDRRTRQSGSDNDLECSCVAADVEGAGLFCIFDGHCGRQAAEQAMEILPNELAARLPAARQGLADGSGLSGAWEEAFLATDDAITCDEGCTATVLLVWRSSDRTVCIQVSSMPGITLVVPQHGDGA